MCSPELAAASGSMAFSAYSQYATGKYNQDVADQNAKILRGQAKDALARGSIEEQQHRMRVLQEKGAQTAALAANGVDIGQGSAIDMLGDTAATGELEALTIRSNAQREAYGYRVQAVNEKARGRLAMMEGKFGAFNTILTSGSKMAGAPA